MLETTSKIIEPVCPLATKKRLDVAREGGRLGSMILEFSSSLGDSVIQYRLLHDPITFPHATFPRFFNTSRGGDSTTALGIPFQCLTILSGKRFFLIFSLYLPWTTRGHYLSSFHSLRGRRDRLYLTITSFQGVAENNNTFPQLSLLQTEQSQLLQPLPIRPVLHTPQRLHYLSLGVAAVGCGGPDAGMGPGGE